MPTFPFMTNGFKWVIPLCPRCGYNKHCVFNYGPELVAECEKCKFRFKSILVKEDLFPHYVTPRPSGNFSQSYRAFIDLFLEQLHISPFEYQGEIKFTKEPEEVIITKTYTYKELALKYHPDVCKLSDAHERFVLINKYKHNQEKLNEMGKVWE